MEIPPAIAAAIVITGNFVLSLGMAIQKRHVGWIGKKKAHASVPRPETLAERRREGRALRDFAMWFLGFMLVNIVPVFQYFALMGLSTNIVGAAAGTSIAFSAILAVHFLKERMGIQRLFWTLLLLASIVAAGFLGEGGSSSIKGFSPAALYVFLGLPLIVGLILFILRRRFKGPRLAAVLAGVSGALGGFMVFPLRALQVASGPGIVGWLASPYLYSLLAAGVSSLIIIQVAYKDGEMASVAPAFYGMQVLWPALGSFLVFGAKFLPAQIAAFALVAVCVVVIAGVHATAKVPARRASRAKRAV